MILPTDDEKDLFCDLIRKKQEPLPLNVYHYCIMGNHFHFAIEVLDIRVLSAFVSGLCSSYSKAFRARRHMAHGLWAAMARTLQKHSGPEGKIPVSPRSLHRTEPCPRRSGRQCRRLALVFRRQLPEWLFRRDRNPGTTLAVFRILGVPGRTSSFLSRLFTGMFQGRFDCLPFRCYIYWG